MSQYGYGGQQNPYGQRDNAAGGYGRQQQGGYGSPYGGTAGAGGGYGQNNNFGGSNVEMAPLGQAAGYGAGGGGGGGSRNILDECSGIDNGINQVEHNLEKLRMLQQRSLDDADTSSASAANRQLDSLSTDTMALYRDLTERVRTLKSKPPQQVAQYRGQVDRIDRRLKSAIQQYQQIESQFRKRTQEQMKRQYRIVRPDATEKEVQAVAEDTSNNQVFAQAMMQSDRQGRARAALSAVQDRHAALVKIEQQMVELSQLFQDMDTLVVQQEAAIVQIEQKGEEVVDNLDKGNEEIGIAVNTARKTRKKKWICLGICVAILLVIVIIVLIYVFVIRRPSDNGGNKKREVESLANTANTVLSSYLSATGPEAKGLEARAAIDQALAEEMHRLAKTRIHFPLLPNN
ncbi:uncharacterized protein UV8b_05478 [Ustilaginoidea virens]|uniref:t-SNARE coiled-coil homology domain-containing protein n=1 Tax=Ustilaginoidea virens TaxID=1159556 RepID=A0A8E5HTA5_USTVR|nr:uncharacterized protein UV8b_05478 [Ustilaginoidea virens]QUC21235.1 hypothetical protein UV8b_05478 [Ustilaginoidea virens]